VKNGEKYILYFTGRYERKGPFGRPKLRWGNNNEILR
jgi:hypothetical protein